MYWASCVVHSMLTFVMFPLSLCLLYAKGT